MTQSADQFQIQMDDCVIASLKENNGKNLKQKHRKSEKYNERSKFFRLR